MATRFPPASDGAARFNRERHQAILERWRNFARQRRETIVDRFTTTPDADRLRPARLLFPGSTPPNDDEVELQTNAPSSPSANPPASPNPSAAASTTTGTAVSSAVDTAESPSTTNTIAGLFDWLYPDEFVGTDDLGVDYRVDIQGPAGETTFALSPSEIDTQASGQFKGLDWGLTLTDELTLELSLSGDLGLGNTTDFLAQLGRGAPSAAAIAEALQLAELAESQAEALGLSGKVEVVVDFGAVAQNGVALLRQQMADPSDELFDTVKSSLPPDLQAVDFQVGFAAQLSSPTVGITADGRLTGSDAANAVATAGLNSVAYLHWTGQWDGATDLKFDANAINAEIVVGAEVGVNDFATIGRGKSLTYTFSPGEGVYFNGEYVKDLSAVTGRLIRNQYTPEVTIGQNPLEQADVGRVGDIVDNMIAELSAAFIKAGENVADFLTVGSYEPTGDPLGVPVVFNDRVYLDTGPDPTNPSKRIYTDPDNDHDAIVASPLDMPTFEPTNDRFGMPIEDFYGLYGPPNRIITNGEARDIDAGEWVLVRVADADDGSRRYAFYGQVLDEYGELRGSLWSGASGFQPTADFNQEGSVPFDPALIEGGVYFRDIAVEGAFISGASYDEAVANAQALISQDPAYGGQVTDTRVTIGGRGRNIFSFPFVAQKASPVTEPLLFALGGGTDTLIASDPRTISDINNFADPVSNGQSMVQARIEGDDDDDILVGANDADTLLGLAGDDALGGRGGDDLLVGSAGADDLQGGDGDDRLFGDDRTDDALPLDDDGSVLPPAGDDILIGGAGDDEIDGGFANDVAVYSGARADYEITFDEARNGYVVRDLRPGSPDGVDFVKNVETFRFQEDDPRDIPAADILSGVGVLINGDFESGGTGWTAGGNVGVGQTSTAWGSRANTGQGWTYFGGGTDRGDPTNGYIEQTIAVQPNQTYQLGYAMGAHWGSETLSLRAEILDASGAVIASQVSTDTGTPSVTYETQALEFTPTSSAVTIRFSDASNGAGLTTDLSLDSVTLTRVTTAPSVEPPAPATE